MKTRAILALTAVAGLASAASAQETVTYTLSFVEVQAGTNTPVANPNGVVEPGEGARVQVSVNITPGIGSNATYTPPPAPGTGTIAGLGSIFFDLTQSNAQGGTWNNIGRATGWNLGSGGTGNAGGGLDAAQAGQFVLPGSVANSTNPVANIWRGVWTPSTYANRTVTFTSVAAAAGGANHSSILIQYGVDPDGNPQYVGKFVGGVFGNVNIPVVPSPSSLALLGLGGLVAGRRRR
jgi:hypothetical protein